MHGRHGVSTVLALGIALVGVLPGQDTRHVLFGEIEALYLHALEAHEAGKVDQVRSECAPRYDRLRRELLTIGVIDSMDLALAGHRLAETGCILGRNDAEIAQDLKAEWAALERLPAPRHGAVLLLDVLSKRLYGLGRAGEVAERLRYTVREWPCDTPLQEAKRIWLAVEVARPLLNRCRRPDVADNLLTWAIDDLQIQSPWPEQVREGLLADEELWIVDKQRPLAGDEHDCRGELHLMRAFARLEQGRPGPALEDLSAAEAEFRTTDNQHRLADVRHDRAVLWLRLGSAERAESNAIAAREYYREPHGANGIDHNGVLSMDKVLARVALLRGDRDGMQGALEVLNESFDPARAQQTNADLCVLLAAIRFAMKDNDESVAAMDALIAGSLAAQWLGDNRIVRAQLLHLRVRRQLFGRDLAGARATLAQADPLAGEDGLLGAWQEALLADVARADHKHAEALKHYAAAAARVQSTVESEHLWVFDGALDGFQQLYGAVVDGSLASFLELQAADPGAGVTLLPSLFGILEAFRDGEATFGSAGSRPRGTLDANAELVRATLREKLVRLQSLKVASPSDLQPAMREVIDQIADIEDRSVAVTVDRSIPRSAPASLAQVQQSLQPAELLLEFLSFGDRCAVLCIDASGADLVPIELTEHSSGWLSRIHERTAEKELSEALPAIARALRAAPKLAGYIDRAEVLIVSPEGPFAAVPFAALPWPEARLGSQKILAHVASPSDLTRLRCAHPQVLPPSGRVLAVGNPKGKKAVSLPASLREAVSIARLFATDEAERRSLDALLASADADAVVERARLTLLLGAEATKERLMQECRGKVSILHLACYSSVDTEYSPLSYLALSDDEHGIPELLHAWDFERLAGDYELVALSSCQTGVGPVRGHSAPASLVRAAQAAGARRVLGTLWPVDDQEAAKLVIRFYELWLKEGEGCAAALAHAQREAIESGAPVRAWAGFCLWGEPR